MDEILQQLLNWLVLSSIYTLLAIGFTLIFGVLNVIHFSHGDVAIIAPFVALALIKFILAGLSGGDAPLVLALATVCAILAVGAIGIAVERIVVRPFRFSSALMVLVATVALGIVIRELIRHLYPQGSNPHAFPNPLAHSAFFISNVAISWFAISVFALAVTLLVATLAFLRSTAIGTKIRAVAEDLQAATMMGINVNRIYLITFFMASAIGAVAGIIFAAYVGAVRFDYGIQASLLGFSAAVVGGLGSVYGAVIGGLLLAGVETLAQGIVPHGTAYRLVFVFSLVILFLVFRPTGILGTTLKEKV